MVDLNRAKGIMGDVLSGKTTMLAAADALADVAKDALEKNKNNQSGGLQTVVNLDKGGKVSLTKDFPATKRVNFCLKWGKKRFDGPANDLDAAAFCLDENRKIKNERDFVFYNPVHLNHPSGAVIHSGDNTDGTDRPGMKCDEMITVDLTKLPADIKFIEFSTTIYDAIARGQHFGMVDGAETWIEDADTGVVLAKFDLTEDYSGKTALVPGEFYRHNDEIRFKAIGEGYVGGLKALCDGRGLATDGQG